MKRTVLLMAAATMALAWSSSAFAGKVFLTGHDPDFHSQSQQSGKNELNVALNYVTNGTYNDGIHKFLFVESNLAPTSGHLVGENGLISIGLTPGVNFDQVNAAGLAALPNFNGYSAIVVASDFGGMLTSAEINELVARKSDIATFVNNGGGLAAFAECGPGYSDCIPDLVDSSTPLFGFVPIGVSSVSTTPPYFVTAFGASLGLTNSDVQDCCTHNSFAAANGLNIVDTDQTGIPTTLAGNVDIGGGGFHGVPEPATWAMMLLGVAGLGAMLRRRRMPLAA